MANAKGIDGSGAKTGQIGAPKGKAPGVGKPPVRKAGSQSPAPGRVAAAADTRRLPDAGRSSALTLDPQVTPQAARPNGSRASGLVSATGIAKNLVGAKGNVVGAIANSGAGKAAGLPQAFSVGAAVGTAVMLPLGVVAGSAQMARGAEAAAAGDGLGAARDLYGGGAGITSSVVGGFGAVAGAVSGGIVVASAVTAAPLIGGMGTIVQSAIDYGVADAKGDQRGKVSAGVGLGGGTLMAAGALVAIMFPPFGLAMMAVGGLTLVGKAIYDNRRQATDPSSQEQEGDRQREARNWLRGTAG